MVFGTIGFSLIEGRSIVDSAYFAIVTMATVGYGDVHPVTTGGKIFTVVLIIMGVGTFLGVIANITEIMLTKREDRKPPGKVEHGHWCFYSEVGLGLLAPFSPYDPDFDAIRPDLIITASWTDKDFSKQTRVL